MDHTTRMTSPLVPYLYTCGLPYVKAFQATSNSSSIDLQEHPKCIIAPAQEEQRALSLVTAHQPDTPGVPQGGESTKNPKQMQKQGVG